MSLAEELGAEAQALEQSGDQSGAHQKWLAAASEDGRNVRILTGLGRSHLLLGNLAEAEAILREASALDPEDGESLWLLGFTFHSQGRWEDARNTLERGLSKREWSTARIMQRAPGSLVARLVEELVGYLESLAEPSAVGLQAPSAHQLPQLEVRSEQAPARLAEP